MQSTERVEFLNDPQNFTGYSQVIRETHRDGSGELTKEVTYTFGLDELSQTTVTFENGQASSPTTVTFAHDGHGSVRALLDAAGAIATLAGHPGASAIRQLFTYDAYGNAIGFNMSAAATVLLYSGEQFDQRVQMQYLRARFYDAANGRLVGLDPYFGDGLRPTTFNKYAYTSGDPIRFTDPSGMSELIGMLMSMSVGLSNRGKESGGSLSVLNSVYRAKDGIDYVYGVAGIWADLATGNYAGVAKSLLGVDAGEIKKISNELLSKNLTNFAISSLIGLGAPITLSLDLPDTGKLGKALRWVKNWIGKSDNAQEVIGEVAAYLIARLMNFVSPDLKTPKVHGPDFWLKQQQYGFWGVVEAKGGRSKLSRKETSYGFQMDHQWIGHWYEKLGKDNELRSDDGKKLLNDYQAGTPIMAAVVSLNLDRKDSELKMAVQAWTANAAAFNKWQGF